MCFYDRIESLVESNKILCETPAIQRKYAKSDSGFTSLALAVTIYSLHSLPKTRHCIFNDLRFLLTSAQKTCCKVAVFHLIIVNILSHWLSNALSEIGPCARLQFEPQESSQVIFLKITFHVVPIEVPWSGSSPAVTHHCFLPETHNRPKAAVHYQQFAQFPYLQLSLKSGLSHPLILPMQQVTVQLPFSNLLHQIDQAES